MRTNTYNYTIGAASKIGHAHVYCGRNNQDSFCVHASDDQIIAVVTDGCGEGKHSEVGSAIIAQQVVWAAQVFNSSNQTDIQNIFKQCVYEIMCIARRTCSIIKPTNLHMAQQIKDFWSSTILGLIIHRDKGFIFHAGDGIYILDDKATRIMENDTPRYLAYNCVSNPEEAGIAPEFIQTEFCIVEFDPSVTNRIMIATDGFENHNDIKLRLYEDAHNVVLPRSLHNEQWNKTGQCGLSKWMNVKSSQGYFEDDCTIITVERL